jgi:polar amino acid transport system ATP-binding protein
MEASMKLQVSGLVKKYGSHRALDSLSLDLPEGTRCLALIGPSGGGKSTLLRHLGGLELPSAGHIEVNGKPLPSDEKQLRLYRRRNGFLFQGYNLFPHLTALQNIILPLVEVHCKTTDHAKDLAIAQLARFGLESHAGKFPLQLSGGQQQRVALIRSMVASPELLFLDEPTAALDPEMTVEVLELVQELILGGQDVVLCTHEMGFARAVADRVAFVSEGKISECTTPKNLFDSPKNPNVKQFLGRVLEFR